MMHHKICGSGSGKGSDKVHVYGMDVMYTMVWHAPMHTICKTTYAQITMEPKCCTQTTETAIQDFGPATSQQHEPNLTSSHLGTHPIVNVVLQMAITDPKLEVLKHTTVFHDVERIEHIEVEAAHPRAMLS